MTIQILHYEFMGPIPLDQWGPPMEDVVYILLGRDKERFSLIYAGQCEKSDDVGFFTKNPLFKCWVRNARSETNLYVAIYPMFGSSVQSRRSVVDKIVFKYKPQCNLEEESTSINKDSVDPTIKCACCGSDMKLERSMEKSNLFKCDSCGISDTRLK